MRRRSTHPRARAIGGVSSRTLSRVALALLAAAIALAACTPAPPAEPNQPPEVSITSPAPFAELYYLDPVQLEATATDPEDGDITDITWSSDVDGELTPDANGEVQLSPGEHVIMATVTDSAGEEASDSIVVNVIAGSHVVTEGTNLRLVAFDDGQLTVLDTAALPADGLTDSHQVFGIARHPTEPWLYVASMNTCSAGDLCWGDGRIDRFTLEGDDIEHAGVAFVYEPGTEVDCAEDDSGTPGQVGTCALNGIAFSPDGSRLYVDDDSYDWLHAFAVNEDGSLEFLAEGGMTFAHGLAVSEDGRYVYDGYIVNDVQSDEPVHVTGENGGNSTTIVEVAGERMLLSTDATTGLAAYDLVDPAAPAPITNLPVGDDLVRDFAFTEGVERLVVAGAGAVRTFAFDGATFTPEDTYTSTDTPTTQYRAAGLDRAGDHALVAWFATNEDTGERSGGMDLFAVAADGSLSFIEREAFEGEGRVVFRVR